MRYWLLALVCLTGCPRSTPSQADADLSDAAIFPDAAPTPLCPPSPAADHLEWCFASWSEVDSSFAPTHQQGFGEPDQVFVNSLELGPQGGLQLAGSIGGAVYSVPGDLCQGKEGLAIELVLDPHSTDPAVPLEIADSSNQYSLRLLETEGQWQVHNRTSGGLESAVDPEAGATAGPQYVALFFAPSGANLVAHRASGSDRIVRNHADLYPLAQWRAFDRLVVGRAGAEEMDLGWLPWTSEIHYLGVSCMPLPTDDGVTFARSPI
jgi:hypothetical protein